MDALASPSPRRSRRPYIVTGIAVLVAAAAAWWMTGPPPSPADAGLPDQPPPVALPADTPDGSPVAVAAAMLATGQLDGARTRFIAAVAAQPDDEVAQVGLMFARWRTSGPRAVERDLTQLAREYPDSAFVAVHLGMARSLIHEATLANAAFRDAIELGRADTTATGRRMARLADDLLHPGSMRGYLPVLVRPREVSSATRPTLDELLTAVERDDRVRVTSLGRALGRRTDPMARVAAAAATYTKDAPVATARQLDALADDATLPPTARNRALLLAGLARAWSGSGRDAACVSIRRAATPAASDAATVSLAAPIADELC